MKNCAVTGHRELPENFNKTALYEELEALIVAGYDNFLCGMAEGFDLLCLDCLVSLRLKYRITIEACVPFKGQQARFLKKDRELYDDLINGCDKITFLSENYFKGCFLVRDRYMVDHCDLLFAYCKKETGGARYTVNYAESKNIPVAYFEKVE